MLSPGLDPPLGRGRLEEGMRRRKNDLSVPIPGGGDMKRTRARESSIFLPPPSSLRLSHPPSTPVIAQRGGMPYGCKELLSEMFSLS